jgi:CheY-like chemotaxis protein
MENRILVVEDNEALRTIYEEELGKEGYDVTTARNGFEALAQLNRGKADLIVLDIVMPEMGGMEAISHIVQRHRDIPVILYSSHPQYIEYSLSWAADAYLIKSADLKELKNKIHELLTRPH